MRNRIGSLFLHSFTLSSIDQARQGVSYRMKAGDSHPPPLFFSGPLKPNQPSGAVSPGPPGKLGNMQSHAFQFEIEQLRNVSLRLDSLADDHPIVEKELISISGNIRSNAVLLEVLLATRIKPV